VVKETIASILAKWEESESEAGKGAPDPSDLAKEVASLDLTEKMHQITQEKLANFSSRKVEQTEEQKRLKAAILQGYSEVADGSTDEEEDSGGPVDLGPANTNAADVAKENAEQKARSAEAAQAKKDKDKQDRANQKAQAEDRKKKAQEKSAKGERKSGR